MKFEDFVQVVNYVNAISVFDNNKGGIRKGQNAYNLLVYVRPDISAVIDHASMFDPYHSDNNLPNFWDFVAQHWKD